MKLGIILSTNESEVVWNAFRLGNTALKAEHEVKVFLINKGVEVEDIEDEKYDLKKQLNLFFENKGEILACGTCLRSRQKEDTDFCPISTIENLLTLVEESDKILTFG